MSQTNPTEQLVEDVAAVYFGAILTRSVSMCRLKRKANRLRSLVKSLVTANG